MQKHAQRHFTAYTITIVIYAVVAFLLFYSTTQRFVSSEKPKETVVKMSLSQFIPEVVAPPEPIEEKIEVPTPPEPVVEKEPEPEIVKEVVPKPIVKKETITPVKKVIKKEEKPRKKVQKKKKEVKKTKPKKKVQKKTKTARQASSKQQQSTSAQRNKFWNALRKKIDRKKSYPRVAKKRGMEGIVEVKFTILRSGEVGTVSVKGPKIFHNSAKKAVQRAFPIDVKNAPISLPSSINIKLRYQLR